MVYCTILKASLQSSVRFEYVKINVTLKKPGIQLPLRHTLPYFKHLSLVWHLFITVTRNKLIIASDLNLKYSSSYADLRFKTVKGRLQNYS